jgi:hypothetical protein
LAVFQTPVRLMPIVSLPGGVVEFEGRADLVDARVRDDDVEPAELGDAVVQGRLQGRGVPHVRLVRDDPPVKRLYLPDRLRQVFLAGRRVGRHRRDRPRDVDRDDVGALLREPDGVTAALAARRPGDESDLALHPSRHGQLLRCLRSPPRFRRPAGDGNES